MVLSGKKAILDEKSFFGKCEGKGESWGNFEGKKLTLGRKRWFWSAF